MKLYIYIFILNIKVQSFKGLILKKKKLKQQKAPTTHKHFKNEVVT